MNNYRMMIIIKINIYTYGPLMNTVKVVIVSWVMWSLVEVRGCKGLGDWERIEDGQLGDW